MPRISDATGWEPFEDAGWGVMISYPVDIVEGVDTQCERRFSYVRKHIALSNWYRVVATNRKDRYFYGERALPDARRYASDMVLEIRREGVLV